MADNLQIRNGLYRIREADNKFRFFRMYFNNQNKLKIKEFRNGDLNDVIEILRDEAAMNFYESIKEKLEFWQ